jgi:simple sugar transport system substrate-binding protein
MDVAMQVQLVEEMIAQGVDALAVIPFSPEALEPVFRRAMDQGIVVITHEADNQINMHFNIEAFENDAYGINLMRRLASGMNYQGEYAVMVGSLTSKSHNQWADAAIEYQLANFPNMTMVGGGKIETVQAAYDRAMELLQAFPNLRGIQGSDASDAPMSALAVEELGLEAQVYIVGTSLVSISQPYLESGALNMITFWDPADAAYVMNKLAVLVLEGREVYDGMDLGVSGYESISVDGRLITGNAWIEVTTENMDQFNF